MANLRRLRAMRASAKSSRCVIIRPAASARPRRSRSHLQRDRSRFMKSPNPIDKHVGARRAHAPADGRDEPEQARRSAQRHVPADPEIRKGRQSHRRQPVAAARPGAGGAAGFLLRGRARRPTPAPGLRRAVLELLCRRLPLDQRGAAAQSLVRRDPRPESAQAHPRSGRDAGQGTGAVDAVL